MSEYSYSAEKMALPRGLIFAMAVASLLFAGATVLYSRSNRYVDISCPDRIVSQPGQGLVVPVRLYNKGRANYTSAEKYFLSGKLTFGEGGTPLDLPRMNLELGPGERLSENLIFAAPMSPGTYNVQVDIVKEGAFWLSDEGNKAASLRLDVKGE